MHLPLTVRLVDEKCADVNASVSEGITRLYEASSLPCWIVARILP